MCDERHSACVTLVTQGILTSHSRLASTQPVDQGGAEGRHRPGPECYVELHPVSYGAVTIFLYVATWNRRRRITSGTLSTATSVGIA